MDVRSDGPNTKTMKILEEQKSEEIEIVPLLTRLECWSGADGSELRKMDEVYILRNPLSWRIKRIEHIQSDKDGYGAICAYHNGVDRIT